MTHAVSTPPRTFAQKLRSELARRTAAAGSQQGARTVARAMVAANPARDLEQTRASVRRWLKGTHVPTQANRDEVTDALGMTRGSLDPDAEEEDAEAMLEAILLRRVRQATREQIQLRERIAKAGSAKATALAVVALIFAADAGAAASPQTRVHQAMTQTAGRPFQLDCSYAARDGAPAIAYPDSPPVVYAKPWVCGQARSFVKRPTVQAARALLILTHEALHIRLWAGARDEVATECAALDTVADFARMLGARAAMADAVQARASEVHREEGWPLCP